MSTRSLTRPWKCIPVVIALALGLLLILDQSLTSVQAARQQATTGNTYVVNSTDDLPDADLGDPGGICAAANGKCTLRAAIMQANFVTGLNTITVPSGVYVLTRSGDDDGAVLGDLDIADDLTLQGAGSGVTIVDGNGAVTGDRVFQILSSAKETSLSGLTIRNGKKTANTFDEGGGLYWDGGGGHLRLHDVVFEGNTARYGGGIYSELFIHNNAALTMTNSTLSGNSASRDGGGLYAVGGQINLYNATIANNHVLAPLGTFYAGMGGGLYITATAIVAAQNTLIADNTHRYQILLPEPDDCFASVASLRSLGYNLIEMPDNCLISGTTVGNITGQDPMLGPLQNNGGSTQTQAPLVGSPAIDAGQTPFCSTATLVPLTVDQRGWHRPNGDRCDIGAVEVGLFEYLPLIQR